MVKNKDNNTYGVILDTSFMIRLLSPNDPLHDNAMGYFRYFLENDMPMYFSTISIAEYCVKGELHDLPFRNIRVLPFNIFHAQEAGRFARALFDARSKGLISVPDRLIVPNDSKIFAQGSYEREIKYFVTSDVKSKANIEIIRKECGAMIEHLDIHTPFGQFFGILDLD